MNKHSFYSIFLFFIATLVFTNNTSAQNTRVEDLKRTPLSKETLLYKITPQQARYLVDSTISFTDVSFFTSFVKELKDDDELLRLPYGHYLKVSTSGPNLVYEYVPVSPFLLYILDNSTDFLVQLKHKQSEQSLDDYQVKLDKVTVPFDQQTLAYRLPQTNYHGLLEISKDGEQYFYRIEKASYSKSSKKIKRNRKIFKPYYAFVRTQYAITSLPHDVYTTIRYGYPQGNIARTKNNIENWLEEREERRYERKNKERSDEVASFAFFSKPKYKPRDTVSFKVLLMDKKTKKWLKEPLTAKLVSGNETFYFGTVAPKNGSGYHYTFKLHDSMKLRVDKDYSIYLIDKDSVSYAYCFFRLEEYELKKAVFKIENLNKEQIKNKPFEIKYTAKDENGLPMRDTKAEIKITALSISNINPDTLFVPYQFWQHEFVIEDGTKTFILPDSIFSRANYAYQVNTVLRNAENEKQEASFTINYLQEKQEIKSTLHGDSITISAYQNDSIVPQLAKIEIQDRYEYYLSEQEVMLPYTAAINTHASSYFVSTPKLSTTIKMDNESAGLACNAHRNSDSVFVHISNTRNLQFTYQIYERNKELKRGHGKVLQTAFAANEKDIYYVALQYVWAGKTVSDVYQIPLDNKIVQLAVDQPQVIYPGKETEITITATDYKGKPVKDMSILTYAYTAKFPEGSTPTLPNLSTTQKSKYVINNFTEGSNFKNIKSINLNYPYWSKYFSIDSMLAYRFRFPKQEIERIEIPMEDSITQVAPFVTIEGVLQGVHYVLVNNVPVYFGFTDHKLPYSFELDTTGYYELRIRTQEHLVIIDSFKPKAFTKTMFTVDLAKQMRHVKMVKMTDGLSKQEIYDNSIYIVKLNEINTSSDFRYLSTGLKKGVYKLNVRNRNNYDRDYYSVSNTIGPIIGKHWRYNILGEYAVDFELEHKYTYTFKSQLVKMVKFQIDEVLISNNATCHVPSLSDQVISEKQLLAKFNYKHKEVKQKLHYNIGNNGTARLQIELEKLKKDTLGREIVPANLILTQPGNFNFITITSGYERNFTNLQAGTYQLLIIEENGVYRKVDDIKVQADGINFFRVAHTDTLKSAKVQTMDSFMNKMQWNTVKSDMNTVAQVMGKYIETIYSGPKDEISGIVLDENNEPMIGASIRIKGTSIGTYTDIDGEFSIDIPLTIRREAFLEIDYAGYTRETVAVRDNITVKLSVSGTVLYETVVIEAPYGPGISKERYVGAADRIDAKQIERMPISDITRVLEGAAPGIQVTNGGGQPGSNAEIRMRGIASISSTSSPLYVIDGVPYGGDIASLDPSLIESMKILKDASATSIYGPRGANGVILITTKLGAKLPDHIKKALEEAMPIIPEDIMVSSLRNNFKDDAFWQPNLVTDKDGKVHFKVTFPDDLTAWKTFVYATDDKMRVGQTTGNIKSFKPVSAALLGTQFLVQGDTANFIGKSVNYIDDTLAITNSFYIDDSLQHEKQVQLTKYNNETLMIAASQQDSIKVKYLLTKNDGYFDGEEKTVPIFPSGVSVAKGAFMALDNSDTSFTIPTTGNKEPLHITATASLVDIVLDEIDKVKNYQHLCNEQLSSKIIATLQQQRIYNILKKPLDAKHKADVQKMINLLLQRQNGNNLWGWWGNGNSITWISQHVIKALQMAKEMKYTVGQLNFERIVQPIVYRWENDTTMNDLQSLKLLHTAGMKIDYEKYISRLEKRKGQRFAEKLEIIQLRQQLKLPYNAKLLDVYKQEDIFGNIFWKDTAQYIYENEVLTTLTAFKIIQADSSATINKHKVINWLLKQRKTSGWRNIYESSQIVETIASAIDFTDTNAIKPKLTFEGGLNRKVTEFPFEYTSTIKEPIRIQKSGAAPVYFTWYQRHWDTTNNDLGKDFIMSSSFIQEGKVITELKSGKSVQLKVTVKVPKEAEFVMIEVPIPAGCSYESKSAGYGGNEVHREYYKNKVSIFCERLPKGDYTYTIQLLPRFAGKYHINPAKAELMYFPVFYGRTETKKIDID